MKQTRFSERKIQMSETLSRRVGRLVSGGFHALIDAAENLAPEAVMNESIREIERAVDEVRAGVGQSVGAETPCR